MFFPFVTATWNKFTKNDNNKYRGLVDDTDQTQPNKDKQKTRVAKLADLVLMLEMVANWANVISRQSMIRNSTSLDSIWQMICAHYGFQISGIYFLDLADMKQEHSEKHQDLYQRLVAFVEDNLVVKDGPLSHHGEKRIEEDEDMTPSLENMVVMIWLKLIHKDLPRLVKQKYGTELRSRTLASIKPDISVALDSLLNELQSDTKVLRAGSRPLNRSGNYKGTRYGASRDSNPSGQKRSNLRTPPSCPICKDKGKPDAHFISKCPDLPEADKCYINKTRHALYRP